MKVKCLQFLNTVGLLFLQAISLVYQGKFAFNFWVNYKASIIGILIMLALNNINYKASIISILKYKAAIVFDRINEVSGLSNWFVVVTLEPK